jgi:hypothetical protein
VEADRTPVGGRVSTGEPVHFGRALARRRLARRLGARRQSVEPGRVPAVQRALAVPEDEDLAHRQALDRLSERAYGRITTDSCRFGLREVISVRSMGVALLLAALMAAGGAHAARPTPGSHYVFATPPDFGAGCAVGGEHCGGAPRPAVRPRCSQPYALPRVERVGGSWRGHWGPRMAPLLSAVPATRGS